MPKCTYGNPETFRGYTLIPEYHEGRLVKYHVWRPNTLERDDEPAPTFYEPDARDKAKRWVMRRIAEEKYPRITMRRVSKGR